MLNGRDYVAVVRITDKPGSVLAAPGDTCERVPVHVLEGLERRGRIKRVPKLDDGIVTSPRLLGGPDGGPEVVMPLPPQKSSGFAGVVRGRTRVLAGEAGREHVNVKPADPGEKEP